MASSREQVYAIVRARVTPLLARVLERVLPVVPAPVQRIGTRAMTRLLRRFEELSEILGRPPKRKAPTAAVSDAVLDEARNGHAAPAQTASAAFGIDALLSRLSGARIWQERADAARSLGAADSARAVDGLTTALRDRSAEVGAAAATSLGRQSDGRAGSALAAVIENADGYYSSATRAAAVTALASRRVDLEPVFKAVRDIDAEVSVAAIFAILEFAPQAAGEQLVPVIQDRSYFLPLTRVAAAHALERSGALSPAIARELLQNESDGEVRAIVARFA